MAKAIATKTEQTSVIRLPKRTSAPERTAAQAYAEHAAKINELASRLVVALQGHTQGAPVNWAHVGDLTEVERLLGEAVAFLTGEEMEGY